MLVAASTIVVCWRAYQAGDATTGLTFTSTLGNWWESCGVTYSGCDTTTPIDAASFCFGLSAGLATQNNLFRAPSILPNFNSDTLLVLYANGESAGRTIAVPGGTTSRANVTTGPTLRIADKTLTDGTPTGDIDTTCVANTATHFGMSIALKTAGASGATLATARPTFGAIFNTEQNASSFVVHLDFLAVQNGDLVVVFTCGPSTTLPLAGWTQLTSVQGANIFYRTWSTGDTMTPTFSVSPSGYVAVDAVALRRAGSGTWNPAIDTSGVNSATSTAAVPALTPAGLAELLLTYFGSRISGSASWSGVTGGLSDLDINSAGPCLRFSSLMPSGSPTTAYSATLSGGNAVDAAAVLIGGAPVSSAAQQALAMVLA